MGRIGFQKLAGYTNHFHFGQLSSHSYCGFDEFAMLISFEGSTRYQRLSMQCFDYPMIHCSLELLVESSDLLNIFGD